MLYTWRRKYRRDIIAKDSPSFDRELLSYGTLCRVPILDVQLLEVPASAFSVFPMDPKDPKIADASSPGCSTPTPGVSPEIPIVLWPLRKKSALPPSISYSLRPAERDVPTGRLVNNRE